MRGTSLFASLLVSSAIALQLPIKARRTTNIASDGASLSKTLHSRAPETKPKSEIFHAPEHDNRLSATIELGDKEHELLVDTGSSSLWVYSPKSSVKLTNSTKIQVSLQYRGSKIEGPIAFAEFELDNHTVSSQAFINVAKADNLSYAIPPDSSGVLGLSFDSMSDVYKKTNQKFGDTGAVGRTPLSNVFRQKPEVPNFATILFGQSDGRDEGTLTIGEYVDSLDTITHEPKLPRKKVDIANAPSRWNIEVEGISAINQSIPLKSTFPNIKPNTVVGLLDTGSTFSAVDAAIADAIYGTIPGAVKYPNEERWIVPCLNTTTVAFKIGGKDFAIHPLDLSAVSQVTAPDGQNYTVCLNTFRVSHVHERVEDVEMILGVPFFRNVYAAFNWEKEAGRGKEEPFVQLLSITDPNKAATDFVDYRTEELRSMPKELSPNELVSLLKPTSTLEPSASSHPTATPGILAADGAENELANALRKLEGYMPAVMICLAGIFLFLMILCVVAISMCIRRGAVSRHPPKYAPVRLREADADADRD